MTSAVAVLSGLAGNTGTVSDHLRAALILEEVRDSDDAGSWMRNELNGYESAVDLPSYRVSRCEVRGDAFNGAWLHQQTRIPLAGLPVKLASYACAEVQIRQNLASLEQMLASGERSFRMPWGSGAIELLNSAVAKGATGVHSTYSFLEVWWEIPSPAVGGIIEKVRLRALELIDSLVPIERRLAELAPSPRAASDVRIEGSGNQVMIASPGGSQAVRVLAGDWDSLASALSAIGVDRPSIEDLRMALSDDTDESTKVMRLLGWTRRTTAQLGIGAAGSTVAALGLEYLGLVGG